MRLTPTSRQRPCGSAFPTNLSGFLAETRRSLAPPKFISRHCPAYDYGMSIELIIAGILGVFLLVYLVYSIVRPDRF